MQFPDTNKKKGSPIPESVESNAHMLEEHLSKIHWPTFRRAYLEVLGLVLVSVFALVLVVGVARWLTHLLYLPF